MTLAAPRSRQGRLLLVLAIVAATVAAVGALTWASTARADIPAGSTVTLTDNSVGGIPVGGTVTYTHTVNINGIASGTTTGVIYDMDVDPNLFGVSASSDAGGTFQTGECNVQSVNYRSLTCIDAAGPADDDVVTSSYVAIPVIDFLLFPPCGGGSYFNYEDAGTGNATCVNGAATGDQFIDDYIVTPATGENSPGTPHTIAFTLPPNFTCESDLLPNDALRTCDATDVDIVANPASVTLVSGPTVVNSTLNATSDVIVVINSPQASVATVTLNVKYDAQGSTVVPGGFINVIDPDATKTYAVVGAGNVGELRHRDEPDLATEDAADLDIDPFCATVVVNPTDPCGILVGQDDVDDATGSFHQACIVNTLLTATVNNADITWHILPGPGSSATVNPGPNGQKIAGPDDIPCVRWSSGGTGTQAITATYDNGIDPATEIYYDATIPLPLIKEWNDIDETHIVTATGIVGDTLAQNTLELGGTQTDWENRDCSFVPVDAGLCTRPNLDGLTLQQEAAIIINSPQGLLISAPGRSFIDYTFGNHSDAGGAYDGPVDGAEQTYTISGDCGSVRLEDPASGNVIILSNANGPTQATVLSSDKGVGFTFLPTDDGQPTVTLGNADCGPNAVICIDISTEEDNLFRSPPIDDAEDEQICIEFTVGPPTAKTPILAWAGQRVVVEHYWGNADGTCPELDFPNGDPAEFGVLYSKQAGPGSFTAALQNNGFNDVDQASENVIVDVDLAPTDDDQDGITDANSGCISRVIYESEDQGEVDISAYVVDDDDNLNNADPRSQQVAFVIYYMKFEDLVLGLVPGARSGHNSGTFDPANPIDPSTDVDHVDSNVSADVLARVRVRGWVETDNCPARDSAVGSNGEFIPANRCIFPDDWNFKAGGALALETRPNFDILNTPPTAPLPGQNVCSADPRAAGPFSLLDTNVQGDTTANVCGDSQAPNVTAQPCLAFVYSAAWGCRETVFPNGIIDKYDAPMPPALVRFLLTGSGFLHGADKDDIYTGNSNLFYATHIPAEPWIAPINQDLSGYQWNTWGVGGKAGQYDFWDDLADKGAEVISCPGASPCAANVGTATGGYLLTKVYTDNHGEAMTWINGDANLTFDDCASSAGNAGHNIVLLNGFYCEEDDVVGDSTLTASVDYPDKRKHFAIDSNDVTITWLWGGIKEVTVEPGAGPQFNYVVLHLTDRDGFCDPSPSLHPVIGEQVTFLIDSPNGVIFPDNNGIPAALLGTWSSKAADVTTFDTDGANSALTVEPVIKDGECQAWIHVSESLLGPVNVIVTAYDPEGTVVFDVIINEPTPTPAPVTPSPTPANQENLWADIDCDDDVNPVDSLKVLRHDAGLSITQNASCPDAGESVLTIWDAEAENEAWGDADCSGDISPVDSLKILRFDAGLFYIQQEPCPDIGSEVLISAQ